MNLSKWGVISFSSLLSCTISASFFFLNKFKHKYESWINQLKRENLSLKSKIIDLNTQILRVNENVKDFDNDKLRILERLEKFDSQMVLLQDRLTKINKQVDSVENKEKSNTNKSTANSDLYLRFNVGGQEFLTSYSLIINNALCENSMLQKMIVRIITQDETRLIQYYYH